MNSFLLHYGKKKKSSLSSTRFMVSWLGMKVLFDISLLFLIVIRLNERDKIGIDLWQIHWHHFLHVRIIFFFQKKFVYIWALSLCISGSQVIEFLTVCHNVSLGILHNSIWDLFSSNDTIDRIIDPIDPASYA